MSYVFAPEFAVTMRDPASGTPMKRRRAARLTGRASRTAVAVAVTMRDLNGSVAERISDHPPLTVDLPLAAVAASRQN